MRYHWGMGVGHIHAHGLAQAESLPHANTLVSGITETGDDLDTGQHSSIYGVMPTELTCVMHHRWREVGA